MKKHQKLLFSWLPGLTALALISGPPTATAATIMGSTLESFAILGATAVTNVPTSTVVGNVGVSPGTSITAFNSSPGVATADPQVTGGLVHTTTAVAAQAQFDLTNARTNLGLLGGGTLLSADLVGLTIFPGVYTVPFAVSNLTGTVTLDGQGNANAAWVFQFDSSLITSSGSTVNVINTGAGAGIFWNVASSATFGSSTSVEGNILALTSISFGSAATIGCGRALADNGNVTMIMDTIGIGCSAGTGGQGSNGFSGGLSVTMGGIVETPTVLPFAAVQEPSSMLIIISGFTGLGIATRRRKGVVNSAVDALS